MFNVCLKSARMSRKQIRQIVRWLEWGIRSYFSFVLGLSFGLFAIVIVATGRIPRPIGFLMGLSGLANMAQGWVIGAQGFSNNNTLPTLSG
jgi:hypothetical protein